MGADLPSEALSCCWLLRGAVGHTVCQTWTGPRGNLPCSTLLGSLSVEAVIPITVEDSLTHMFTYSHGEQCSSTPPAPELKLQDLEQRCQHRAARGGPLAPADGTQWEGQSSPWGGPEACGPEACSPALCWPAPALMGRACPPPLPGHPLVCQEARRLRVSRLPFGLSTLTPPRHF